jgi:hypothetical protein
MPNFSTSIQLISLLGLLLVVNETLFIDAAITTNYPVVSIKTANCFTPCLSFPERLTRMCYKCLAPEVNVWNATVQNPPQRLPVNEMGRGRYNLPAVVSTSS